MRKPLKRDPKLQWLSRDHHQQLIFCWNLKKGVESGVCFERMFSYIQWFFEIHLSAHWEAEKEAMNNIAAQDEVVTDCLQEQNALKELIPLLKTVAAIDDFQNRLYNAVRKEERTVFEHLQKNYKNRLQDLPDQKELDCDIPFRDEFWK